MEIIHEKSDTFINFSWFEVSELLSHWTSGLYFESHSDELVFFGSEGEGIGSKLELDVIIQAEKHVLNGCGCVVNNFNSLSVVPAKLNDFRFDGDDLGSHCC